MRQRVTAWILMLALAAPLSLLTARTAEAQSANKAVGSALTSPITGTVSGTLNGVAANSLTGNFTVTQFAIQNGQLVAIGTLSATILDAAGNILTTIVQQITLPATATGTCNILHLTLGPLDLNLLGLQVHLNQIVLDITAQSGPGNLLGNLLCAIANLLNTNAIGSQLVNLLNQLLGILAGL